MKSIKVGVIVSIIITAPVFLLTPVVVYLISEFVSNMIKNEVLGLFVRSILLISYCALTIMLCRKFLFKKHAISDDDIKPIIVTISKYIIPSILIGLFYAAQKYIIGIVERAFDEEVYIYSDLLSRLEMNLAMMLSIVLLVVWWSYDKMKNSG